MYLMQNLSRICSLSYFYIFYHVKTFSTYYSFEISTQSYYFTSHQTFFCGRTSVFNFKEECKSEFNVLKTKKEQVKNIPFPFKRCKANHSISSESNLGSHGTNSNNAFNNINIQTYYYNMNKVHVNPSWFIYV